MSKGKIEEARAVLARYHANGDLDDELVQFQLAEIIAEHEDAVSRKGSTSWLQLFATPGNRKRSLICVIVGFGSQWNGYGITS